jgi:hypothetical protein
MGEETKRIVVNGGASLAEGGEDAAYRVGIGIKF